MITVIKDNHVKNEYKIFQVKCPHCDSEFQFQLDDLKLIEKCPNGRRLIDCPCCSSEFDTANIAVEVKDKKKTSEDHPLVDVTQYSEVKEIDIDGEKWWHCIGFNRSKEEDRKLKVGDAVVYIDDDCPDEHPVIIIKSFDFPCDIAARAVIGMLPFKHSDGHITTTYYSDFVPAFDKYRIATDEEVMQFLIDYKEKCNGFLEYDFRRLRDMEIDRYNKILDEIYFTHGLGATEGD